MAIGNYPYGSTVGTQVTGMSPEMEAKYLWLMDQARNLAKPSAAGPLPAQQVAEFTPYQTQALDKAYEGIGAWQDYLGEAPQYDAQGKQIKAGTGMVQDFDPESYKQYLDPYQDYVTQGISEQYDKAIDQANMGAAGKGAFGGSRQGIMNAELLGGKALGVGQSLSQGYGTAMGLAKGDFENKMQRYGMAAGMTQQLGQGDVASLMGAGSIQQQRNQQVMDADYQAMLTNRYDPQQRFGWMSDIFRGQPSGQMAMTYGSAPQTNPLSQALGAGIFGAGVASGWQNT